MKLETYVVSVSAVLKILLETILKTLDVQFIFVKINRNEKAYSNIYSLFAV